MDAKTSRNNLSRGETHLTPTLSPLKGGEGEKEAPSPTHWGGEGRGEVGNAPPPAVAPNLAPMGTSPGTAKATRRSGLAENIAVRLYRTISLQ